MANEEDCYKKLAESMDLDTEGDDITIIASIGEKMEPEKASDYNKMEQFFETANKNIADILNRIFYIGSLCTDFKNRLMWSHYADSHRGFCVEYDFTKFEWDTFLFPILYSEHRVNMPWKATLERNNENETELAKHLFLSVLTKDSVWEYENEWRVLIDSSKKQDFKMPPISCIYLGVNCTDESNIKKIVEIAEKLGVPVKQMREDRVKYSLYPISL